MSTSSQNPSIFHNRPSLSISPPRARRVDEKRQLGRQRVCALRPRALNEVITWVDQCKEFWEESFDQLQALVAEVKAQVSLS